VKDPLAHAEKTALPRFGHQAIRALLTDALGVAPGPAEDDRHRVRAAPPAYLDQHRPGADHLPALPGVAARRVPVLG
jgi:hypothetical protein